jgi:hypothetical protein
VDSLDSLGFALRRTDSLDSFGFALRRVDSIRFAWIRFETTDGFVMSRLDSL